LKGLELSGVGRIVQDGRGPSRKAGRMDRVGGGGEGDGFITFFLREILSIPPVWLSIPWRLLAARTRLLLTIEPSPREKGPLAAISRGELCTKLRVARYMKLKIQMSITILDSPA